MGSFLTTPSEVHRIAKKKKRLRTRKPATTYGKHYKSSNSVVLPKRSLYSTIYDYQYYCGQLGVDHFFELYLEICGVDIYGDECDLEWNILRQYLGHGYTNLHTDILTSDLLVEKTVMCYLRVEIIFRHELDEFDFRTDSEKEKLAEFGKLGGRLLDSPVQGQQLFCTIKTGDMYTTTFIKFPFMTEVFKTLRLSTKSAAMSSVEARLKSCKRFQDEETYDTCVEDFAQGLADAGLYLTTDQRLAQCFECGGLVSIEQRNFEPWKQHAKYHPCCPYVLQMKGQEYVDRIRKEWRKQTVLQPRCVLQFDNRRHAPAASNHYNYNNNDNGEWTDGSDCSDYYSDDDDDLF